MIGVTADVQIDQAFSDLQELARGLGVTTRDACYELGRLTAQDLVQRTPPLGKTMKLSLNAGKGAIRSDLAKIFGTLKYFTEQGGVPFIHSKSGVQCVRMPDGRVISFSKSLTNLTGDKGRMSAHHQSTRSGNTGRVMGGSAAPRMQLGNKAQLNSYMKLVYNRIGQLASGWIPALLYCSARSPVKQSLDSRRVPDWVLKWPNPMSGTVVDTLVPGAETGTLTFRANWRFGYPSKYRSLWANAIRARSLDMDKWIRIRLRDRLAKFNGRAAA